MKVSIIGSGYVGLVAAACFAEMGNTVMCIDINEEKIKKLKKGIIPIYEPGLEKLVLNNLQKGDLTFSTDIVDALKFDIVFIAVGTPMGEDGSADLKYVLQVAKQIGENISHDLIIVNKSTVPIGTADKVKEVITNSMKKNNKNYNFHIVSNPEFLKEGVAIKDFMHPDRVIVGSDNNDVIEKMKILYSPFLVSNDRFIDMDIRSAEMTKYAANSMLATKISFINEIANICEKVGANVNKVRVGIGSDNRIGYKFIYPGCGYGGSCFPKDVQALIKIANKHNLRVIEDAAQSPGIKYKGKPIGSIGDIGGFSLNFHKHIHCGEGGMIVTNDKNLAFRAQLIRNQFVFKHSLSEKNQLRSRD